MLLRASALLRASGHPRASSEEEEEEEAAGSEGASLERLREAIPLALEEAEDSVSLSSEVAAAAAVQEEEGAGEEWVDKIGEWEERARGLWAVASGAGEVREVA